MRVKHLWEWLQEHQEQEALSAAEEAEDEGVMSELGGRERWTGDRIEEGEWGRMQTNWEMVVDMIQMVF